MGGSRKQPTTAMTTDANIPATVRGNDAWTFYCETCGLPFMQSFAFHNEAYHDGNLTADE